MRRLGSLLIAAFACYAAACGRGVSEDPLAGEGLGGTSAIHSSGSSGSSGSGGSSDASGGTNEPPGTGGTSGSASGSGGRSTGGQSGTGGADCPERHEYAQNECRLVQGERCELHDECASGNCADGVCCNAPCNAQCEHCDGSGACVASETDAACQAPRECAGRDRCRLPDGQTCDEGSDCKSNHCKQTDNGDVCCESPCDGLCQACSPDGTCSDYPARDTNCSTTCSASTRCVTYVPPAEPGTCTAPGVCAACTTVYKRAGIPCGVGQQCDGAGACKLTGRGMVAAGERHTCAINDDANVVCWGDNRFGQLGAVFGVPRVGLDQEPFLVPHREIDFDEDVVQITAGAQHTCVLFDTGDVRCWGTMYNHPTWGPLSSIWGTTDVEFVPGSAGLPPGAEGEFEHLGFIDPLHTGNVILAEKAEQISAAPEGGTICAVLQSGRISCWGLNLFGQLGLGHRDQLVLGHEEFLPVTDLGERVIEVRSGLSNTCALTESGRVQCWGDGIYGRLGSGESGPRYSPDFVDIGESVIGLTVGFDHTCVLLARGAVRCWGNNHQGQLGYGHTDPIGDNETPAEAAMNPRAQNVALGGDVALDTEISQVTTFPASSTRSSIGIWDSSPTCALSKHNQIVRCWGRNDVGQLGYGHNLAGATEHTPVELGGIRVSDRFVDAGGEVLALAEGGRCALRRGDEEGEIGSLYCWGLNDHGQVGVPGSATPSLTMKPYHMGPVHWWVPRR